MKDEYNWIFNGLPDWLRWVLSPIVSFFGGIIAYLILILIQTLICFVHPASGINLESWFGAIIKNTLFLGCILYMLFLILPKKKALITGIISVLASIGLFILSVLGAYMGADKNNLYNFISGIIIFVISIYLLINSKNMDSGIDKFKHEISDDINFQE